jgi:hypothetical protein
MIKVIFECCESRNEHQEVMEFEDGTTDEEIEQEYAEWVWNEIGSNYCWYKLDKEKK